MSFPEPPAELWGLWTGKAWVRAIDCAGDPLCVYKSEADAIEGQLATAKLYGFESVPVRIK